MYTPIHAWQGMRYALASLKQKIRGPTRYQGSAHDICTAIVRRCWNGKFYSASTHHYREFWTRDFGYCAESLIKLGYRKNVLKTIDYALRHFKKRITTTITRHGIPFSFPNAYSPDSVALFFHALRVAKADIRPYERFLKREAQRYADCVLENGRVKRHKLFSGMRDYARRDSSCYDHCMSILMARETKKLGIPFPYTEKELVKTLTDYWDGYYHDDRSSTRFTGDANTLPYWLSISKHFPTTLKHIQEKKLDKPFPLAYSTSPQRMISAEVFVPNWETMNVWPFLGLIWAHSAKQYKPALARKYKQEYADIIEKYGTLYELYTQKKTPYTSWAYHADEGMLWSALFLTL